LLTKPDIKLTRKQEIEVKKIAANCWTS